MLIHILYHVSAEFVYVQFLWEPINVMICNAGAYYILKLPKGYYPLLQTLETPN